MCDFHLCSSAFCRFALWDSISVSFVPNFLVVDYPVRLL